MYCKELHASNGGLLAVDKCARVSAWSDVLKRMKEVRDRKKAS